jgi:large subunit ribosomal protein L13
MKTTTIKEKDIKRVWHLVDLKGQVLGRVTTDIATKLIGKNKVAFSPNLDCGDYVVCINAAEVQVTGTKSENKMYQHHTMYPGGLREINYSNLMKKDPREVIIHAIKGMLPKNKLRDERLKRLKIFVDENHPYEQQLAKLEIKEQ